MQSATPTTTMKPTLEELLERAASEKDRSKFEILLDEINAHLAGRHSAKPVKGVSFRPSMETDTFDIFAGPPDRNAVWRESAVGIVAARKRMEEIADAEPGDYFLFYERRQSVVSRIHTGAVATAAPAQPVRRISEPIRVSAAATAVIVTVSAA